MVEHEQHSRSQNGGDVRGFPTFFAGHARILLQFKTLQVEGVTVVSEGHPRPRSQGVGALAGVDPLVAHRLIWQEEKQRFEFKVNSCFFIPGK